MHAKQLSDPAIARIELQRLQSREQTSLLFVEQTEEEDDGCLHLFGERGAVSMLSPSLAIERAGLAKLHLPRTHFWIRRTVQVQARDLLPRHAFVVHEPQQRSFHLDMEAFLELVREVAGVRGRDERLQRRQQGTVAGEPDGAVRPETLLVEASDLVDRVVATTV